MSPSISVTIYCPTWVIKTIYMQIEVRQMKSYLDSHRGSSVRWCLAIGFLALLFLSTNNPGDIIELTADCYYKTSANENVQGASDGAYLVVCSPLRSFYPEPVFLAQGWERSCGMADGMVVRAFVMDNGEIKLEEGIQLSDGRILVDNRVMERAVKPGG